jgi:hypothetical protein
MSDSFSAGRARERQSFSWSYFSVQNIDGTPNLQYIKMRTYDKRQLAIGHAEPLDRKGLTVKHEIEIWLSVDSEGTAAVSIESADDAREKLADNMSSGDVRTVRLMARITLPQVIEVDLDIPDDAGRVDAEAA